MTLRVFRIDEVARAERAQQLCANAAEFAVKRGIDVLALQEKVVNQYPAASQVVLTSSLTQGLATPTSDIDFIAVTSDPLPAQRMAAQIYVGDHHCEVVAFSEDELVKALSALKGLASDSAHSAIGGITGWDSVQPISRKYIERIINGVSVESTVPNSGYLGDLSVVWALQAMQRFLENIAAMRLSILAGERRAPAVYAVAAVLDAMDGALNRSGYVFSNRKWYLSRWAKDSAAAMFGAPSILQRENLRLLFEHAQASLGSTLNMDLAARIEQLVPAIFNWFFVEPPPVPSLLFKLRMDANTTVFGRGAHLVSFESSAVLLPDVEPPTGNPFAIASLSGLDPKQARWLLGSLRAGLIEVELVE